MLGIIEFIFSIIGIYGIFTENLVCIIIGLITIIIGDFVDIFISGHNPTSIFLSLLLAVGASLANKNPLYTFTIALCGENLIMSIVTILILCAVFIYDLLTNKRFDKETEIKVKRILVFGMTENPLASL